RSNTFLLISGHSRPACDGNPECRDETVQKRPQKRVELAYSSRNDGKYGSYDYTTRSHRPPHPSGVTGERTHHEPGAGREGQPLSDTLRQTVATVAGGWLDTWLYGPR